VAGALRGPEVDWAIGDLAERQRGVVARRQLFQLGIADGAIKRRIARGTLRRLHQGVYAVGHRALTVEARWLAAVLACGSGAALSHRSAGQLWGIVPRFSIAPEVTRTGFGRRRPGIVAHRSALAEDEVGIEGDIRVTSVSRTLFDLAAMSSWRELERALNEAETQQLTSKLSLPHLLERHPGHRGAASLRALLESDAPGGITRNEFEERFVAMLDRHDLPRPRLDADLWLRGRFFEVDCLWEERRLAVELDGRGVHQTKRAFEKDRERDRVLLAEGWRTARVTWRQLRDDEATVAADLRQALAAPR
jgi:very-short-patch-repair endonuclease